MTQPRCRTLSHRLAALSLLLLVYLLPLACNGGGDNGSPTDPGGGPVAFQGQVVGVDGDTLVLAGGLRVVITAGTVFDPDGDLFALDAIQAALQRGETVTVRGTGQQRGAGRVEALEIEVETSAAGQPAQFAGIVATLDRSQGVLTLRSGTLLVLDGATVFDPAGDAIRFTQVVAAFDRGDQITVQGSGVLRGDGAVEVGEIRVDLEGGQGGDTLFAGVVAAVDRAGQRMALTTGVTVAVDGSTRFDGAGDLLSFGALASAVEQGQRVTVEGEGRFRADGSVLARRVLAEVDDATNPEVIFAGVVATVDRDAGLLVLRSGTVLSVDAGTRFDNLGDADGFDEVVAAFDRGDLITVEGRGSRQTDGVVRALELRVTLDGSQGAGTQFAGVVAVVDRASRRLTLTNGVAVAVVDGTRFDATGDLASFDAIATAFSLGATIRVEGEGTFRADGSIAAERIRAEI